MKTCRGLSVRSDTTTFHYMDPPYWQTVGYGVDFSFDNDERMADFMRRCKAR